MNIKKRIFLLAIGSLLLCLLATIVEAQFKFARRAYDRFILDNQNHYLTCADLPTKNEVEMTVEGHKDVVQRIQQVAPGSVGVEIDSLTCEGKADLVIWYGNHEQRVAIERILGGDTFFGIPYRLQNR